MKMECLASIDIRNNIQIFLEGRGKNKGRGINERYASFDYCYNYFREFYEAGYMSRIADGKFLQSSCLQLGFYLASWGMYRGSSFLLEKSIKYYEPLISNISKFNEIIWKIDIDNYTDENIDLILECKNMIIESLGKANNPSKTLVSKIMLGIFGNTPAFDDYFCRGFKVSKFDKNSLRLISSYYLANKDIIDSYQISTLDFSSGTETKRKYSKAKLIDMIGFIEGQNIQAKKTKD